MLHFLRNIRRKLIIQENVRKYLLYAVGEILLVVVGILLAIQINNWYENLRAIDQEQKTLTSLKREVTSNVEILNECYSNIEEKISYADKIRSYLSPDPPVVSVDSVNTWLGFTGKAQRCILSTDILDELQSSGNLQNVRSVELRRQIGRWLSTLEELRQEENEWAREFSRNYIPYTSKWISWDDVDYIFSENNSAYFQSRFDVDPRAILQEFEFSNLFAIHYWRMNRIRRRIESLQKETQVLQEYIIANINTE